MDIVDGIFKLVLNSIFEDDTEEEQEEFEEKLDEEFQDLDENDEDKFQKWLRPSKFYPEPVIIDAEFW